MGTPILKRKMLYMTTTEIAVNSIELKEYVIGGNFKSTSYIKLHKKRK